LGVKICGSDLKKGKVAPILMVKGAIGVFGFYSKPSNLWYRI
jgi:hypothetical protein